MASSESDNMHKLRLWNEILDYLKTIHSQAAVHSPQVEDHNLKSSHHAIINEKSMTAHAQMFIGLEIDEHGTPLRYLQGWYHEDYTRHQAACGSDIHVMDAANTLDIFQTEVREQIRKELKKLPCANQQEKKAVTTIDLRIRMQSVDLWQSVPFVT